MNTPESKAAEKEVEETREAFSAEALLHKCRGWFRDGMLAGIAGGGLADRSEAGPGERPPRARDFLRRLVALAVDFVSTPLALALAQWNGDAETTIPYSVGFTAKFPPKGELAVEIDLPAGFRPRVLWLNGAKIEQVWIRDIKKKDDNTIPVDRCIPASFCAGEGLPVFLGETSPANRRVVVELRNEWGEATSVSGLFLGDLLVPC